MLTAVVRMTCPDDELLAQALESAWLSRPLQAHLTSCARCRASFGWAHEDDDGDGAHTTDLHALHRGDRIGRYEVLELVGVGGTGIVYAAYDARLARKVALKLLTHQAVATIDLEREARNLAALSHPNVVTIYDVSHHGAYSFVAMELVDGVPLQRWTEQRRRLSERLVVLRDAARGIAEAHAAGIIHGDIKPSNILVLGNGRAKVVDFGFSTNADSHGRACPWRDATASVIGGTPRYLAPERLRGEPPSRAGDVFSYCVTVCEVLAGERQLAPGTDQRGVLATLPVGRRLNALLASGLDPSPDRRPQTLDAYVDALTREMPRRGFRYAPALTLVGFGVAVLGYRPAHDCAEPGLGWAPDTRARVLTALERIDAAAPEGQTIIERLDRYVGDWRSVWRENCGGAARSSARQCLQHRRHRFATLIAFLGSADDSALLRAHELVDTLPDAVDCLSHGDDSEPTPPPISPRIETLYQQLTALEIAGRHDQALETAERLVHESSDAPRWLTLAQLSIAKNALILGDADLAEPAAREATRLAWTVGDRPLLVQAWTRLIEVLGTGRAQYEDALILAKTIEPLVAELAPIRYVRMMFLRVVHALHARKGDFARACEYADRALELANRAFVDKRRRALPLYKAAVHCRTAQGLREQARPLAEAALAIAERAHGHAHPVYAEALAAHGHVVAELDDPSGIDELERAVEIFEHTLGPRSPITLQALNALASAASTHARFDEAIAYRYRCLERIEPGVAGPQRRAITLHLIGIDWLAADRPDRADEVLAQAAQAHAALPDSDPFRAGGIATHRGVAAQRLGRIDEAIGHYRTAHTTLTTVLGADHENALWVQGRLAFLRWKRGEAEARDELEHAAGRIPKRGWLAADLQGRWARVSWSRDRTVARELAERALDVLEDHRPASAAAARELAEWLRTHS